MDIMERARRGSCENKEVMEVFYGFPWSDVPDIGTTVHVTTNNDQVLADSIADDTNIFGAGGFMDQHLLCLRRLSKSQNSYC